MWQYQYLPALGTSVQAPVPLDHWPHITLGSFFEFQVSYPPPMGSQFSYPLGPEVQFLVDQLDEL